ncbi:MAG: hypothetical protein R3B41_02745 [Candidatus Doudnabacteria bacterium]
MTENPKNPVTDNQGAGGSKICFVKVVSASTQCDGPFYGINPPHYRVVKCKNKQALLAALRRVLNVADGSGDKAEDFLKEIIQQNSDLWSNWSYWRGYEGDCEVKLHDAVKIDGKLYINI